jgi:hypothetical protein
MALTLASILNISSFSTEEATLAGTLGLAVALMFELHQGPVSPWAPYLDSIPHREYIPIFWTEEELAFLEGTELEDVVDEFKVGNMVYNDFCARTAGDII